MATRVRWKNNVIGAKYLRVYVLTQLLSITYYYLVLSTSRTWKLLQPTAAALLERVSLVPSHALVPVRSTCSNFKVSNIRFILAYSIVIHNSFHFGGFWLADLETPAHPQQDLFLLDAFKEWAIPTGLFQFPWCFIVHIIRLPSTSY